MGIVSTMFDETSIADGRKPIMTSFSPTKISAIACNHIMTSFLPIKTSAIV